MPGTGAQSFAGQQYLNLETSRKSGDAVWTPVWFVEDGGVLFIRTQSNSGKVKRIRNNDQVRVAPCDARGAVRGDWFEGTARLVGDPVDAERVNRLFERKYGMQKKGFDLMLSMRGGEWATIAIGLSQGKGDEAG
jgi:PPOX class probable F420-dependent enzyme